MPAEGGPPAGTGAAPVPHRCSWFVTADAKPMRRLLAWIPGRLFPAVITAAGVSLVALGLLALQAPPVVGGPTAPPTTFPTPRASPTLLPLPTVGPTAPPSSGPSVDPATARVPTRIRVRALDIDLPVVRPPDDPDHFPYCNVAEYIPELSRPGLPGTTYVYAHARTGMFLPILEESLRANGKRMVGMLVEVYTSDDMLFLYEVTQVLRHQTNLDPAYRTDAEQVILQTSEGPRGTIEKTMVLARPLGSGPADPALARPEAHPVTCQ